MRKALELSSDEQAIEGPLKGFHHETYVLPLNRPPAGEGQGRWKCREPREGLFWFDRRCFMSEEELIEALASRVTRIPGLIKVDDIRLQRFVEGRTLGNLYAAGTAVPHRLVADLMVLFQELSAIRPQDLPIERRCDGDKGVVDGDTEVFLQRLVRFVQEDVYASHQDAFGDLFEALGVGEESFDSLHKLVQGTQERPFSLLHADLHRENLIVDSLGKLWFIDWELAMFGDPIYDLATHLYLMRYPAKQEREVITWWRSSVERVRPHSSRGLEEDLPKLLGYKRAQSVFTDVIRAGLRLDAVPHGHAMGSETLARSARKVSAVLGAAAEPLGLTDVPSAQKVAGVLAGWLSGSKGQRNYL
ncbi:phosphotransferase [Streptomyces sp. NPDC002790]|uniref:phosphotransferase n=1 Tax=Streptomyces sp. NPDC002790 TaxID=3154431 RepID=UPI0033336033